MSRPARRAKQPLRPTEATENGLVNTVLARLGMEPVPFLIIPGWFRPLYIGSDIWQHFRWRAIIYLAALTAIDQEQYDAAWVDGANRWQQLRFIPPPGIAPTIIILMILSARGGCGPRTSPGSATRPW